VDQTNTYIRGKTTFKWCRAECYTGPRLPGHSAHTIDNRKSTLCGLRASALRQQQKKIYEEKVKTKKVATESE
jgi:hypothetical protein